MNDPGPVAALLLATAIGADWESHEPSTRAEPFRLDLSNVPNALKSYPRVATRQLSRHLLPSSLSAIDVLSGAAAVPSSLDDDRLAAILYLSAGITRGRRTTGAPAWFRTAMSAGNLHPLELYVIDRGLWHYDPLLHRLELVRATDDNSPSEGATVIVTGIPARTCWKYAERGFRHLFWDAGTMLANLLAAADAYGVDCSVSLGFDDAEIAALVGIEAPDEVPIALVSLGAPSRSLDDHALGPIASSRPITRTPIRFDQVSEALAASCLSAADVEPWRARTLALAGDSVTSPTVLPPSDWSRIEEVILRRGSSRHFRRQSGPARFFDWALPVASRPTPIEVAASGTHIGRPAHVHAIEGVEPGVWTGSADLGLAVRWEAELLRDWSARCCLGQDLGGDSCVTLFLTADLETLLREAGGRAYRVAAIEAGIVAGRLALCASALGAGATGLTFVDELIATETGESASGLLACTPVCRRLAPSRTAPRESPINFQRLSVRADGKGRLGTGQTTTSRAPLPLRDCSVSALVGPTRCRRFRPGDLRMARRGRPFYQGRCRASPGLDAVVGARPGGGRGSERVAGHGRQRVSGTRQFRARFEAGRCCRVRVREKILACAQFDVLGYDRLEVLALSEVHHLGRTRCRCLGHTDAPGGPYH